MWTIILAICIFLLLFSPALTVIKYGRGIVMPNFSRVDRILAEKNSMHSTLPQWNSTFGKIMYYSSLVFAVLKLTASFVIWLF